MFTLFNTSQFDCLPLGFLTKGGKTQSRAYGGSGTKQGQSWGSLLHFASNNILSSHRVCSWASLCRRLLWQDLLTCVCSEHVWWSWNNFLESVLVDKNNVEDAAPHYILFKYRQDRLFRLPSTLWSVVRMFWAAVSRNSLAFKCMYFSIFYSPKYTYFINWHKCK